jgi:DNA polymerase-1
MLRVSDAFAGDAEVGLLLQVHDELVFEVTEGHAPQVAAQARELMAGALHLAVPVMVDAKVGRNWGDMSALG